MKSSTANITFDNLGINDQIPYTKVDFIKVARVNNNYAISCYQMDYQAFALSLTKQSELKPEENKLMPVAKIVMDEDGYRQFLAEIFRFNSLLENQKNIEGKHE